LDAPGTAVGEDDRDMDTATAFAEERFCCGAKSHVVLWERTTFLTVSLALEVSVVIEIAKYASLAGALKWRTMAVFGARLP
jgi:hypothetical protein